MTQCSSQAAASSAESSATVQCSRQTELWQVNDQQLTANDTDGQMQGVWQNGQHTQLNHSTAQ